MAAGFAFGVARWIVLTLYLNHCFCIGIDRNRTRIFTLPLPFPAALRAAARTYALSTMLSAVYSNCCLILDNSLRLFFTAKCCGDPKEQLGLIAWKTPAQYSSSFTQCLQRSWDWVKIEAMAPIISISNLTKTYASGHRALKRVDLEIRKGEIFALLGPNGAGKTTLISIVCGIVTPTEGVVVADGHDIVRDYRAARSKIGLVPQELSTDAFESVWATVSFSRGLFGRAPNPAHIERVLRDLSLWDKRQDKIMTLSGGMKRRVMIAKALAHEPQILFLDEPTAGVDVELRRDMWALVRRLRDKRRDDHLDHPLHRRGRGDGRSHRRDQQGRADSRRGKDQADEEARQKTADAQSARAAGFDPVGAERLAPGAQRRAEPNWNTPSTPTRSAPAYRCCCGG